MPTLLAVSLSNNLVTFASIKCERDGEPRLESYLTLNRKDFVTSETVLDAASPDDVPDTILRTTIPDSVSSFISDNDFSDVVCLFEPDRYFSELLSFPFDSISKVEQVAPLELEEALPFEIEEYVTEAIQLQKKDDIPSSEREYLIVGVDNLSIKRELEFLRSMDLDPVVLAPKISVLSNLGHFFPTETIPNGVVFLAVEDSRLLFSLNRHLDPILQRDIQTESQDSAFSQILPTLLSASRILPPQKIFSLGVGLNLDLKDISCERISYENLNFKIADGLDIPENMDSVGMLALATARIRKMPSVNFRKGAFRYRGSLKSYMEPFVEDKSYVGTLLGAFIAWICVTLYAGASEMAVLNKKAHDIIADAFPGEFVATGSELLFVDGRLQSLESTMNGLGNISSLSPLEALRELSEVVTPGIDVTIDSLSTTQAGVQFGGSVQGMGSVGKLFGALEKREKFCDIKVDPRGNLPGGDRVRIVGEFKYCP
jgi:hypothetical protein